MSVLNQSRVGNIGPFANGTVVDQRAGQFGDIIVSELNGRYYEQCYRGNVFTGANTAAQALSVASATYTGLAVSNPTGSGKNLVILDIACAVDSATAGVGTIVAGYAAAVTLTAGSSTGPLSNIVGNAAGSVAKVGASATLGAAPTIIRPLFGVTATTAVQVVGPVKDDVGGMIIVPPGQLICLEATGTAISVLASITWAELPV